MVRRRELSWGLAAIVICGTLVGSAAYGARQRESATVGQRADDANAIGSRAQAPLPSSSMAPASAVAGRGPVTVLAPGDLLDLRLDISTFVSATGGNWNDISNITGLTTGLIDFNTGAPTPVSIQGAGWLDFYGDDEGAFPNRDWLIQPATVDGAGLFAGETGTFVVSGLPAAVYRIEVVSARPINTITVNGALASRTSLGTPVQTPWGSDTDGLVPGNWLIWDGVTPLAGAITITDEANSETLAMINAVRILGTSPLGGPMVPTLSTLGALILVLVVAGAAVRLLRG